MVKVWFRAALVVCGLCLGTASMAQDGFHSIPTQFIAALADPGERSGSNAGDWGLWTKDPGPRGVYLYLYPALRAANFQAPAGWKMNAADWWLEEHGLMMEQPQFPLAPGRYLVTGGRETVTVLTVEVPDATGAQNWRLEAGTIGDVTHLACRSARYRPATAGVACTPDAANSAAFPVSPGGAMPPVENCAKRDYAVLFVVGMADES